LIKHQESFNAFVLLTADDQDLIYYILLYTQLLRIFLSLQSTYAKKGNLQ